MANERSGAAPGSERDGRAAPQFTDEELAEKIESRRLPPGLYGAFILLLCLVTPFVTFAITYDVAVRYLFNDTLIWLNDVTGYLLAALTFLGGAYVMSRDGHTRVDILVTHAPVAIRRPLTVVDAVLVLAVCLILAVASGYTVWDSYQRNVSVVGIVQVPRAVVLAPIFIGTVLLCIERVRYIRRLLRDPADGHAMPAGVEPPRV
ncbi:MAG TPA: TRAP transporter small permease [Casimicrobiaceae bacterium]|nr:TRAP transporter small permease [Casimicrobiaceae bacterium]